MRGSAARWSGLLVQPMLAAGPYGVREIRSISGPRACMPSVLLVFLIPSC